MAQEPFRSSSTDFLGAFGFLETDAGVLLVANERRIGGRDQLVWDLPGGRVEAGETLREALFREMREECGIDVVVRDLLFLAEGERVRDGERTNVWRSFFFTIEGDANAIDISGDPAILDHRFVPRSDLEPMLWAPYHAGFLRWLSTGANHVYDRWAD